MKKILIISDSHGLNTKQMIDVINTEKADLNIHAGDYCISVDKMQELFDYFVDGNNDYDWQKDQIFTFENHKFLLIHGDTYWTWNNEKWYDILRSVGKQNEVDIVIFGHSHNEFIGLENKPYLINPGSFSLPRNKSFHKTYAVMKIDKNNIKCEIKYWH